jgi:hypothetical protein
MARERKMENCANSNIAVMDRAELNAAERAGDEVQGDCQAKNYAECEALLRRRRWQIRKHEVLFVSNVSFWLQHCGGWYALNHSRMDAQTAARSSGP